MAEELSQNNISNLFACVLEHLKCIELRIEAAKGLTSQKQKYALTKGLQAARSAINNICDLMPDTASVMEVKKHLDRPDLVYLMLITEEMFRLPPEDVEYVIETTRDYIEKKYGKIPEVPDSGEN